MFFAVINSLQREIAVNMIDNFEYEQIVIKQYIKLRLQNSLSTPAESSIPRVPYDIYLYCTSILKREKIVDQYLLKAFREIFYLKDVNETNQPIEEELARLYRQLIARCSSNKMLYLCQINVRLILLGLSIKLGKKEEQLFRHRFRELVKKLQIELVINGGESLSNVIIKEFEHMRPHFDDLQYYEELKTTFEKLDVFGVVTWIENALDEKRKQFDNRNLDNVPFKAQGTNTKMRASKFYSKRVTAHENGMNEQNLHTSLQKKKVDKSVTIGANETANPMASKNKKLRQSSGNKQKISNIALANQLRKSMPPAAFRVSSKYIFKSTKKTHTQEVTYFDECQTDFSPTINQNKPNIPHVTTGRHHFDPKVTKRIDNENCITLCEETPPRKHKKKQHY